MDHVDSYVTVENTGVVDRCIFLDHDHDHRHRHRHVSPAENDVKVARANVVDAVAAMSRDDFYHRISAVVDREQARRRFPVHRFVHLPYIYMLVQHLLARRNRYGHKYDEDVDGCDATVTRSP